MRALVDIFAQVFRSIGANKLRSLLTMFGIAWGVASLLLLIGLGEGFRSGQRRSLSELGDDIIMTWGGTVPALPNQHTGMRPYKLTIGDVAAIRSGAAHVRNITGILNRGDLKEVSEFSSASGPVWGIEANFPQVRKLPIARGRALDVEDVAQHREVVVLGKKNNELLFPGRPSVGAFITINGHRFQVIGVADKTGRGNNNNENQRIFIPLTTMLDNFAMTGDKPVLPATNPSNNFDSIPRDAISSINYQPLTADLNETAKADVHRILAQRHGFDPSLKEAFEEWDTIKSNRTVGVIFTAMDVFLGGVGIVTLALGAVGIVNIMLVTVTERTKEIGLRKALGATKRTILAQFFLEALMLTGLSGVIGIAGASALMLGLGAVLGNNKMGFDPPRLVPWSAAMALGSLSICGVLAGLYPAHKAASLEPVEALRKE